MTDSLGAAAESAAAPGRIVRWFGSREFFALFNVQVISALGDWVGFFAITSLAAAISSQPEAAIALVTTARIAPGILFTPFIGVIVDRFNRKTVMIVSDLVRAGVFVLLPLVRTVPGLVFASLLLEVFTMVWSPAKEATVPELVPPEKLTDANSLGLVAAYATMPVAGPIQYALGALNTRLIGLGFLGFLGFRAAQGEVQTLAFYFNALSFVVAAGILWKWVFPGMTSHGLARAAGADDVVERDPVAEERSRLRRTWDEIREGWEFIFSNDVVRAVIIGLATGLIGGAMLVPLGPTFARYVIGDATTFPLFITALGLGVAAGVVLLSMLQRRLPKEQTFVWLVFGSGISMLFGVSMSNFWLAAVGIFFLGLCAGSVYVLGFTLLQEHTDDEMRGRIFATLLTVVRLCVLLALVMGPFMATMFNGLAGAATGASSGEVPTVGVAGIDLAIPGVRLTLWLAGLIILIAGVLSARSMKMGLREGLRAAIGTVEKAEASRANHPTARPAPPVHPGATQGWTQPPPRLVLPPSDGREHERPPPFRGVDLPAEVTGEIAPIDVPTARPRPRPGSNPAPSAQDGSET